jgi:molybdenum cofactor guanylyltransferase
MSKRNPRGTSARAKAATTEIPGIVLAGGPARRTLFAGYRKSRAAPGPVADDRSLAQSGSQVISQAPLHVLQCAG